MTKNKMGSMSSLSKLSGIKSKQPESQPASEVKSAETPSSKTTETLAKVVNKKTQRKKKQDKLVTVNIKIRKDQKNWLTDTASQVRDNNLDPVPPAERVYPQHLIGIAIDLLQNVDVDWERVKNVEGLREYLNI